METVRDFIFLGSKITADGDCSHEIKRHLLLGRKTMTNLDSILKSRDVTMLTKILLVKAMVFPVVTYGCESWTIKKNEHWRIDACELWCWRRLLRVPWTARRSNQSILKAWVLRTDAEAETSILWPPDLKSWLIAKDPDAGKDWRWEEKGMTEDEMVEWHHWLDGREFEQTPGVGDGQEAWSAAVPGLAVTKITKYWLYSLRCATRAWACLTLGGLCLPHPRISPRPSFPPLLCSLYLWVCFFFVIFTSLLYFLDSTFKWYCLCLTYFPYYNAFEVHPCCSKWQNFVLFYRWILFRCVYLSIHSFTDIQSGCFLVLARKLPSIVNNASKHLFKWKIWRTYPDKHARAVSYFFFLRVKHCNCHRLAPGMSALR